MNWLKRLLGNEKPSLTPQQSARLLAWHALREVDQRAPFSKSRFVVLDVETTGLNLKNDNLISIGAVSIVNDRIALGDSFSVIAQQNESSNKANILVHGISGSQQREGDDPVEALLLFLEYIGKSPLVAFHVAFDKTMIQRAIHRYLGFRFNHPWLDLAYLIPALNSRLMHSHRTLDDWANHFNIHNEERHNAVADALVTAQLMLISISQAKHKDAPDYDTLRFIENGLRNAKNNS